MSAIKQKVEELFTRSLSSIDMAVLILDGIDIGEYAVVMALGIDSQAHKHILGIRQGSSENTELVKALLQDIIEWGISTPQVPFVMTDGGKALNKAVRDVFGIITRVQRCTVHKKRNVLRHLPEKHDSWVSRRLRQAYNESSYEKALSMLTALAEQLDAVNPAAAESL